MKEIFCTLGPSSTNPKFLKNIKRLGVTLVRINLSHTKIKDLSKIIRKIRKYTNIPICIDTEGAQIRTALCKKKFLRINQFIKISNEKKSKDLTLYPNISNKVKRSSILDIGFENLKIKIVKKNKNFLFGKVISSGYLEKNKGVHIINQKIKLSPLTNKDLESIKIAKKFNIKNYALSFTNSEKDVIFFNKILPRVRKIYKIETKNAVKNLNSILNLSQEILIDRGDLSKDVDLIKIPSTQRKIQKIAKRKRKKVFVATNLLESMIKNSYPTRAELNDIYNCLELGSNGLVLAAETAIGKWPLNCVKILSSLIKNFQTENKR
tara:strand:- start:1178 stop:2143 length:966 start_codon:yes stop_codon:yes gene_type:complete